jgi:hypothetical protein
VNILETQTMHIKIVIALNEWDPFNVGFGEYEPEIADVVQAVHISDNEEKLATRIQEIYEFSFEKIIPDDECRKMANLLLQIKHAGSCSL